MIPVSPKQNKEKEKCSVFKRTNRIGELCLFVPSICTETRFCRFMDSFIPNLPSFVISNRKLSGNNNKVLGKLISHGGTQSALRRKLNIHIGIEL